MSAPRASHADAALRPAVISNVLVPLSASVASEAALGPAAALAGHFGAQLHLLAVDVERAEADAVAERLSVIAAGLHATVNTRIDSDVPGRILAVAKDLSAIVCMASHARGRLGEVLLGSYTTPLVVETSEPVMLVGPDYDSRRNLKDGPVFACVDGSGASEQVIAVAAGWAAALGVGLRIVTVAVEPRLDDLDDAHRSHGPRVDPQAYVDALADDWRNPDLDVSSLVVYDPIGAAQGLATWLATSPCGLVAVTANARTGLRRAVFGSQAVSILRHSRVPILLVPPAHPDPPEEGHENG